MVSLANADRVAIVDFLAADGEGSSISDIVDRVGGTRFSVSRHLRILGRAGLVRVEQQRHAKIHRLEPAGFEVVEDWLYGLVVGQPSPQEKESGS